MSTTEEIRIIYLYEHNTSAEQKTSRTDDKDTMTARHDFQLDQGRIKCGARMTARHDLYYCIVIIYKGPII